MSAQNPEESNVPVMAKEAVKVRLINGYTGSLQGEVQGAIDRIQELGGRIIGPVSIAEDGTKTVALITYAVPAGD